MINIGDLQGTISLEDEFSSALNLVAQRAKSTVREIEGVFGTVALVATVAASAIVGVASAVIGLGVKGSALNDLDRGFEHLAGSVENARQIMEAMNRGVADTVDSTDLLKFANRALQTGAIKTAQDFGTVTAAARVFSRQGLGPIPELLNTISGALTTGRLRSLQYLTGVIDLKSAEEKYAASIGTTRDQLSAQGKLHAAQIVTLERLNQKVNEAGNLQKSFAEKVKSATLIISNWFDDLAKAVDASPNVNRALDAIGDALVRNFGGAGQTALEVLVGWINRFADAAAHYGPIILDWARSIYDGIIKIWHAVQDAWNLVPDWFKNIAKEAALAGGAVVVTSQALGALGGGESVLSTVASMATITSGLRDFTITGFAAIPIITRIGSAIQGLSVMEVVAISARALGAALLGLATGPVGIAVLFTALAAGIWEVAKAIQAAIDWWKAGKPMWDFFTQKDDDNFIRRWFNLSEGIDETAAAMKRLASQKSDLDKLMKQRSQPDQGPMMPGGIPPPPDVSGDINAQLKKIEDSTKASIKKTAAMWDEYLVDLAKSSQGELAARLQGVENWKRVQIESLEETKRTNLNYSNDLIAIWARYYQMLETAQKSLPVLPSRQVAPMQGITPGALDPEQYAQSLGRVNLAARQVGTTIGVLIPNAAGDADKAIVDAMNEAIRATLPVNAETRHLINVYADLGYSVEEIATKTGASMSQVNQALGTTRSVVMSVSDAFRQLPALLIDAFTGGGGLGGAIKAFGVTITNGLFGKGGPLSGITDRVSSLLGGGLSKAFGSTIGKALGEGIASLIPGIGALIGPLLSKIGEKVGAFFKDLFGGPSKQEIAGREAVAGIEAELAAVLTATERVRAGTEAWQFDIVALKKVYGQLGMDATEAGLKAEEMARRLIEATKAGPEAAAAIGAEIRAAINEAARLTDAIHAAGFQSHDELMAAAQTAKDVLDAVAGGIRTGQYTQEQANKAYYDWQKAMAAAGDAAAEAWVKAHDAVTKGATEASSAISALQKQRDDLTKQIDMEAPELEMGVIEQQLRDQRDAIQAQIDAAEQAQEAAAVAATESAAGAAKAASETAEGAAKAAEETANSFIVSAGAVAEGFDRNMKPVVIDVAKETARVMGEAAASTESNFDGAIKTIINNLRGTKPEAEGVYEYMHRLFGDLDFRVGIHFDVDPPPDLSGIPGHDEGGVFSTPHLAQIAEGGEAEIVGSVDFMSQALAGALSRLSPSRVEFPDAIASRTIGQHESTAFSQGSEPTVSTPQVVVPDVDVAVYVDNDRVPARLIQMIHRDNEGLKTQLRKELIPS